MNLTLISDTHMRHDELGILEGEVLVHCGDLLDLVEAGADDIARVDAWFARQRFDLILCVGGNHDRALQQRSRDLPQPFRHAIYLEDTGLEHRGVRFYGTPWVPDLPTHAYHADAATRSARWAAIPNDTDVVLTHTPPSGILDQSSTGAALGCPHLAARVRDVAPRLHCFGHVHASGGTTRAHGTSYVNAACYDEPDMPLRAPLRFTI